MDNIDQTSFVGWLVSLVGGLLLLLFNVSVFGRIKKVEDDVAKHASKLAEIDKLIAGKYVTTDELRDFSKEVLEKLKAIDTKLDSKADKNTCEVFHKQ